MRYSIELLTTTRELEALLPEWKALWRSDANATPFQSPEWLLPWWKHVGEGELFSLALRDKTGRLTGLVPLYIYQQPATGERHLLLLGAGTSDYLDAVFAPEQPDKAAEAGLAYLLGNSGRWDRGFLHQLRASSPLLKRARNIALPIEASEECSLVTVTGLEQLPKKMRSNINRYRRRAQAAGRFRCVLASNPGEALAWLDELIRLHSRRWRERGGPGVLASPSVRAHHRESVPLLLEAGLLRMGLITIETRAIGAFYVLADQADRPNRRMLYYLTGFDPDFGELSPGTLLFASVLDMCRDEGVACLDLLRGGEEYKQYWGAVPEATFGITLPGDSSNAGSGL